MTDIIPLFGGHTTQSGQHLTGRLARQAKQDEGDAAIKTNRLILDEVGEGRIASKTLNLIAGLVQQAEAHMQYAPAGREMYETAIYGYAMGAARRAARR